jgi:hypothetical protein
LVRKQHLHSARRSQFYLLKMVGCGVSPEDPY